MPLSLKLTLLLFVLGALAGLIGWGIVRSFRRSDDPTRLLVKWILTFLVVAVLVFVLGPSGPSTLSAMVRLLTCVLLGVILTILWAPHVGSALAGLITRSLDGGTEPPDPQPFYSVALAHRKRGRHAEALAEIRNQLAMFPADLQGQMLMAEIQAQDLRDLDAAGTTVQRLCNQPGHSPAQIAGALNALADWHLKLAQDTEAARQALEQIVERLPGTEWASRAEQRIAHLTDPGALDPYREARAVPLAHGDAELGLHPGQAAPPATSAAPDEADALVRHLQEFPADNEAREQLAALYAERFKRLDLAALELEQLIGQPDVPPKAVAHWLNRLADYQLQLAEDEAGARATLQRIIDRFPNHSVADLARQRLAHLKLELRKAQTTRRLKLGTYDPYPGLKKK